MGKLHHSLSYTKEDIKGRMTLPNADHHFMSPSIMRPGRLMGGKADCLHSSADPRAFKDQLLHGGIDVHVKNHDPLPGGILPEIGGRKLPSCKILFHD